MKLTEQLDSHDISRGRGSIADALALIRGKVLIMGIDSDILYPLYEQQEIYHHMKEGLAEFHVIHSTEGHDGFLLEQNQVGMYIQSFLDSL